MTYGYIRVSTDKQDGANQKLGIEDLCKRKGLFIDEYIDDEGVSRTEIVNLLHVDRTTVYRFLKDKGI